MPPEKMFRDSDKEGMYNCIKIKPAFTRTNDLHIKSNNLTILTNGAGGIITSVCICEENFPGLDGGFTLFAIVCCVS